jgi:hypothetical protein
MSDSIEDRPLWKLVLKSWYFWLVMLGLLAYFLTPSSPTVVVQATPTVVVIDLSATAVPVTTPAPEVQEPGTIDQVNETVQSGVTSTWNYLTGDFPWLYFLLLIIFGLMAYPIYILDTRRTGQVTQEDYPFELSMRDLSEYIEGSLAEVPVLDVIVHWRLEYTKDFSIDSYVRRKFNTRQEIRKSYEGPLLELSQSISTQLQVNQWMVFDSVADLLNPLITDEDRAEVLRSLEHNPTISTIAHWLLTQVNRASSEIARINKETNTTVVSISHIKTDLASQTNALIKSRMQRQAEGRAREREESRRLTDMKEKHSLEQELIKQLGPMYAVYHLANVLEHASRGIRDWGASFGMQQERLGEAQVNDDTFTSLASQQRLREEEREEENE